MTPAIKPRAMAMLLLCVHALAWPRQAGQASDNDAARIPLAVLQDESQTAAPSAWSGSSFIETNGERVWRRPLPVPLGSASMRRDVLRLLADGRAERGLGHGMNLKLSARLGAIGVDDGNGAADGSFVRFDMREAALQWQAGEHGVLELGRVNLRQGVATGFNPTDFFKSRSAVDQGTRDPQELRVNRLGSVIASAQFIGTDSSLLVALSPRLHDPASLLRERAPGGARLGDTNNRNRLLIKGQPGGSQVINPELLAFRDAHGWQLGANLTAPLGKQVTLFAEYAGGRRASVLRQALADGIALGDLPAAASALAAQLGGERRWRGSLAAGATWSGERNLSVTTEFDINQAGLDEGDWQRWRALGGSGSDGARLAWYLRGYAAAEQQPLYRRNLFVRLQWDRAGSRDLYVNAFVNRNLDDDSSLAQATFEYRLSQAARLRAMLLMTSGGAHSQNGSDPARRAVIFSYTRYM